MTGDLIRLPPRGFLSGNNSVPPSQKYQTDGGPGIAEALAWQGDDALADQRAFFGAQVLFWLLGATVAATQKTSSIALHFPAVSA